MADIFSSLSKAFFHFCSMIIKECCVPCDFLNPVTHFEILFFMKLLIACKLLSQRLMICAVINSLVENSPSVKGQVFYTLLQLYIASIRQEKWVVLKND